MFLFYSSSVAVYKYHIFAGGGVLVMFSIFNYSDVFGGQERYLEGLMVELKRRGHSIRFIGGPSRLRDMCLDHNRDEVIDHNGIVFFNGNRSLYLHAWRPKVGGLRVYVQHSNICDGQVSFLKQIVRKLLLKIFLMRVDVVIRVCRQSLPDHYASKKIHTVYNGVELPALPDLTGEIEYPITRPLTLLMVGAINDNKNQFLALQLLKSMPNIHLILVGDGPKKLMWQQWAKDNGVDGRIQWAGFVTQPQAYYLQADALLMLSYFEAFPYAVLEAMSFALPVIAVPVGGVPEAITHERDGIILPSYELSALEKAVCRLEADRALCKQLGACARQTVAERFSLNGMVDNLMEVINTTAKRKGVVL
jgi:glycosyltransferase involved in cell wall biosynthesis